MRRYKISDYQRRLIYNKQNNIRMITDIMIDGSYEDIMYYYERTSSLFKGLFKRSLSHLIRPSYKDIYYTGGIYLKQPVDYVGLMAFVLPLYKEKINAYVKDRDSFHTHYLKGDYARCNEILSYIEQNISYSSWGAANRIRIAELEHGAECRTKVYNDVASSTRSVILKEICACVRDVASIDASTSAWYEQKYKNDVMTYSHEPWQKDFIVSHLHPYKSYDIGKWMSFDMLSSIIDLYENFIYNLRLIMPLCAQDVRVIKYLTSIRTAVSDHYLDKYCELIGIKTHRDYSERDFLLTELYTKVPSEVNFKAAEAYIEKNTFDFDFLLEYIKVLVDSQLIDIYGNENGCLFDRVKYHLFCYLKRKDPNINLGKLKIICQSNPSLLAFRQLQLVLSNLESGQIDDFALSYWCYSYGFNLLDACFFGSDPMRSNAITAHWPLLKGLNDRPTNIRVAIYQLALKPSAFSLSMTDLENYVYNKDIPPYCLGMVVSYLLEYYLDNKQYDKVVSLYVDSKMEAPLLNVSINKDRIYKLFTREVDLAINNPLDLSIFYALLDAKPGKIQANAYRYVISQGVDRPSKLIVDQSNKKLLFYLSKVVDRNILDLFPLVFKEPADTIEERFRICLILKKIYPGKKYGSEMNELAKELGIMKMLKEVDASKIDVDENMLKKHEMKQGAELFRLYLDTSESITTYAEDDILGDFFPKSDDEAKDELEQKAPMKVVSYKYLQFARFYLFVRDQFLLNDKAGLDYYMSSRIRHGTIVNQLRHHLQELKLTTRKNDDGRYDLDTYWASDVLGLTGPEYVRCQEAFLRFTNSIDIIINRLKNERVQIKTDEFNKEKDACFDYSRKQMAKRITCLYDLRIDDYDTCVDAIFNDMWDRAEECFATMKSILYEADIEIKQALEKLRADIHEIINDDNNGLSVFNDTLTSCQTFLHEDINAIAGWFQRKQTSGYDFTLQQLVDASIEAVNKINTVQLKCDQNIVSYSLLSSRYLNVLYDLFYNMFTNVVEHAKIKNGKTDCELTAKEDGDMMKITISNTVAKNEIETAKKRIEEYEYFRAHRDQSKKSSSSRTEGKSGVYKIDTIVYYQLKAEGNAYSPCLESNEYIVSVSLNLKKLRVKNENIAN